MHSCLKILKTNKLDAYELLDEFVGYLVRQGNKTVGTIKLYIEVMKSYFAYYDIDIIPATLYSSIFLLPNTVDDLSASFFVDMPYQ